MMPRLKYWIFDTAQVAWRVHHSHRRRSPEIAQGGRTAVESAHVVVVAVEIPAKAIVHREIGPEAPPILGPEAGRLLDFIQIVRTVGLVLSRFRIERASDADVDRGNAGRQQGIERPRVALNRGVLRGQGVVDHVRCRILRVQSKGIVGLAARSVPVMVLLAEPASAKYERVSSLLPVDAVDRV